MNGSRFKVTSDIISKRAIAVAIILFVLITLFRLGYLYWEMQEKKRTLAEAGAETLGVLTMEHRRYYQKMFLDGNIELSEKTLPALPAYSSFEISRQFSKNNIFNIRIQTVSDRARNEHNRADGEEARAIRFFREHPEADRYFRHVVTADGQRYYQYAVALRIERKCLKCHGNRDEAPRFIRERYRNAYGYRLGEVRGILSIKTPEEKMTAFLAPSFYIQAVYDFVLFILLFFLVRYLIVKFRNFSRNLEEDVERRTSELRQSVTMLDEYKRALDGSAIVSKGDIDGNITYVNEAFCRITGYTSDEVVGKNHNLLRHPETSDAFYEEMWGTLLQKRPWHSLMKNRAKDGSTFFVEANVFPILDVDGEIREFIAIRYDVTELMHTREEIQRSYTVDKLTGLPNRNRFLEDIAGLEAPNIALINIDDFKAINDFYGIESGDDLLLQVAVKLSGMIQKNLFHLYRLHSDEFAVVGRGVLTLDEFVALIGHYEEELERAKFFVSGEQEVTFSVSIGFGSGKHAMIKADMALKVAKMQKLPYFVYDENMNLESQYEKNILMAKRLKTAIETDRVVAYYQPILDLKHGTIDRYEALIRVREGDELILPESFLEVAKRTKQYFRLTRRMIDIVETVLKRHDGITVSVNLSIEDLTNGEMMAYLKSALQEKRIASRIVFEILESESIQNYEELVSSIHGLKKQGVGIAIDDFGSGYSNFSHVLQLGVDFIKIDGSLIRNIATDRHSRVLVEGIVEFSKRLNIRTIAEFVENEAILEILREIGVDYAQGFYVGRPSPEIG